MRIFLAYIFFAVLAAESAQIQSPSQTPSQSGIDYKFEWPSQLTPEMKARIESVSVLVEHKSRLPGSIHGLIKRIKHDKKLLIKVLHSFGYYGCTVDVSFDPNSTPFVIKFVCELGPVYKIDNIKLENRIKLV